MDGITASAETSAILDAARWLLAVAWPLVECRGLTLVGVALGNLHDDQAFQLALPFGRAPASDLDDAVDGVRDRFGLAAITRGVRRRQVA